MTATHSTSPWRRVAVGSALALVLASCGSADNAEESAEQAVDAAEQSADEAEGASTAIADALRENGLESIASAVQDIDFAELADSEEFTFFAPNDVAFQGLDTEEMADLLSVDGRLEETLRNHIVNERIDAEALRSMTSIETTGGATLPVAVDGDVVSVGGSTVTQADIDVDDGVVHVVDGLFIDQ